MVADVFAFWSVPPQPSKAPIAFAAQSGQYSPLPGDEWFAREVQPHGPALHGHLQKAFPHIRDVEDVVQESYLRAWKANTTQPLRSVRAFLFTVARRLALNRLERLANASTDSIGDISTLPIACDRPGVAEQVGRDEMVALLIDALATLPPRCREITVLRKLKSVPQREVAAQLGLSEKTVEEQVARGMRKTLAYLRKRGVTRLEDCL